MPKKNYMIYKHSLTPDNIMTILITHNFTDIPDYIYESIDQRLCHELIPLLLVDEYTEEQYKQFENFFDKISDRVNLELEIVRYLEWTNHSDYHPFNYRMLVYAIQDTLSKKTIHKLISRLSGPKDYKKLTYAYYAYSKTHRLPDEYIKSIKFLYPHQTVSIGHFISTIRVIMEYKLPYDTINYIDYFYGQFYRLSHNSFLKEYFDVEYYWQNGGTKFIVPFDNEWMLHYLSIMTENHSELDSMILPYFKYRKDYDDMLFEAFKNNPANIKFLYRELPAGKKIEFEDMYLSDYNNISIDNFEDLDRITPSSKSYAFQQRFIQLGGNPTTIQRANFVFTQQWTWEVVHAIVKFNRPDWLKDLLINKELSTYLDIYRYSFHSHDLLEILRMIIQDDYLTEHFLSHDLVSVFDIQFLCESIPEGIPHFKRYYTVPEISQMIKSELVPYIPLEYMNSDTIMRFILDHPNGHHKFISANYGKVWLDDIFSCDDILSIITNKQLGDLGISYLIDVKRDSIRERIVSRL